ncbi:adhesin biosynthesis transcription regulatory family protein [Klebsiella pneumoniae]|nr:adhesin biosynthesis transcription regulatory family protein [Klebsiella pneumoniae]
MSYFCLCLKKLNYTHSIVSALKHFCLFYFNSLIEK